MKFFFLRRLSSCLNIIVSRPELRRILIEVPSYRYIFPPLISWSCLLPLCMSSASRLLFSRVSSSFSVDKAHSFLWRRNELSGTPQTSMAASRPVTVHATSIALIMWCSFFVLQTRNFQVRIRTVAGSATRHIAVIIFTIRSSNLISFDSYRIIQFKRNAMGVCKNLTKKRLLIKQEEVKTRNLHENCKVKCRMEKRERSMPKNENGSLLLITTV